MIFVLTVICVCLPGTRAAFNRCHFRVRHFGEVFLSPYKSVRAALYVLGPIMLPSCAMWVLWYAACVVVLLCDELGLKHVIQ